MIAPTVRTQNIEKLRERLPVPNVVALILGLGLGGLLTFVWMPLSTLAMLALWPLGLAVALIVVGLANARWQGEALWGMVIGGQILGVTAAGLLFIASLL